MKMEVCASLCLTLFFFIFANTSPHITVCLDDDIGVLNCTSTKYNETIQISSVDFNSSTLCNISNGITLQVVSTLCNNKESCQIQISDVIDNTSCSQNETTGKLQILYNCSRDGEWSEWSGYESCSVTCGGGVQLRSRSCSNPVPSIQGKSCPGNDTEGRTCNSQSCSSPHITEFSDDDIGVLSCTSTKYNETIQISSVDFNSSTLCNISNDITLQEVSTLCNNKESCQIQISDIIDNTSCSQNNTTGKLQILYNCSQDGGWSDWSGYGSCSVYCGGGMQLRSRSCTDPVPNMQGKNCPGNDTEGRTCNTHSCSNPFTLMYLEGETALLTCSADYNETIAIASVNYSHSTCVHTDRYGIQNLCGERNTCTFIVTNSNVGSSCGAHGTATLKIVYNCIRNGGWSQWRSTSPCSAMCGSGLQFLTRNCTNPLPNDYGEQCSGESSIVNICNSHNCFYEGKACKDQLVSFTCPGGFIQVNSATWKTATACSQFTSYKQHDVTTRIQNTCNNRANCDFTAEDTSMGVSCSESFAKCSGFEYVYTCVKATWGAWTEWNTCSKSCGIGMQTRTRSCMNVFNTTDGFINDCDGVSAEDRQCKTDCPYCGDQIHNNLEHFSNAETDLSSGTGYIQANSISCCGRVKQWHIVPTKAGSVTFIIWRKTDSKYEVVGTNRLTVQASDIGKQTTYSLSEDQMIAISKGDIIGWNDGGSNMIGYYSCDTSTDTCPDSVLRTTQSSVQDGDKIDITSLSRQFNRTYAISYTTTNNRAPTLTAIAGPVTIGDHSPIDTFVTRIQLTDPDYGDFIRVIRLDYDNIYFYYDTKSRSIFVKSDLPHTKGVKQETHMYTLTVEDSCYNDVTINVTIVTENEPPLIKGLHHLLQINTDSIRSNLTSFKVEDPSDNVSCSISDTSPLTDMFLLSLSENDASFHLSDHASVDSNSSSQYSVQISCTDGTDNTTFQLTVQFTTNQENRVPDKPDSDITTIIIATSIGAVCFIILIIVILFCIRKWRQNISVNKNTKPKAQFSPGFDQNGTTMANQYASMDGTEREKKQNTEGGNPYVEMSSTSKQNLEKQEPQTNNSDTRVYSDAWR